MYDAFQHIQLLKSRCWKKNAFQKRGKGQITSFHHVGFKLHMDLVLNMLTTHHFLN